MPLRASAQRPVRPCKACTKFRQHQKWRLLQCFAVLADVETHDLVFLANAQWHYQLDCFEDEVGSDAGPQDGDGDAESLRHQLVRIALEQTWDAAGQIG